MSTSGKLLHSKEKNIVMNVYKFFEDESRKPESDRIPVAAVQKRTAEATGVSLRTLQRYRSELLKGNKLESPKKGYKLKCERIVDVDDFDLCVIRNIIRKSYIEKKFPSLSRLLPLIKKEINFPWKKESLRKILHKIGFKYKQSKNHRRILMERPDLQMWRAKYLRSVRKFREEGRLIVYIDETWIDSNLSHRRSWRLDEDDISAISKDGAGHRLIVVHGGSEQGFVPNADLVFMAGCASGDYHGQMNFNNFEKWLKEKLLPNIPSKSVICMDNASYHCKVENPCPTKYSTKLAMREWLKSQAISFDEKMRKDELWEKVAQNLPPGKNFRVDKIIKGFGHDVIRLPPYHCDLNPIELIWAQIKRHVRDTNTTGSIAGKDLKTLTHEAIKKVSLETWINCCRHVMEIEKKYWEDDCLIEDCVETLSFNINDSESEDTDISTSDDDL